MKHALLILFLSLVVSIALPLIPAVSLETVNQGIVYQGIGATGFNLSNNKFYYFLHITDLHLGSGSADVSMLDTFADNVKNIYASLPVKPLAVLDSGDIVDDSGYADTWYPYYRSVLDLSGTGIERLDTCGNHDVKGSYPLKYREYFGSPTYVWDKYVNSTHYVRFIAINTTAIGKVEGYVNSTLLDWLESKISEAENDPNCIGIWVFGHHPPAPNTNENVSAGGWDYKATMFNSVTSGDPWRFVRIIASYDKVMGVIMGHVHENWVTIHYGKYWIITAPLTLRGPWPSSSSRWYTGQGYVYRIVTIYNDIVSTVVARPDQFPVGLIVNMRQGEVVSGKVEVVVLAVSNAEITSVELYIDDMKVADFTPLNTSSYGGLYHAIFNAEDLSDWLHYLTIHVVDSNGNEYWSQRLYFFVHRAGGLRFVHSDLGMISYGLRENYPVARLYIYSEASENFPFAAIYAPVSNSGSSIRIKALLDTEHIPYRMRMRFALVTWKEEPSYNDKLDVTTGMLKLVAGFSTEKNDVYPYDFNAWRQMGNPSQWWGDYHYITDWWPAVGYWGQVTYNSTNFKVELWLENESYGGPHMYSYTWTYANTDYDYDDIRYAGLLVRTDTGYYSQTAIAYLEIEDANGIRKYHMVPNIIGIPVTITITNITGPGPCNVSVEVVAENNVGLDGTIVLQGSSDNLTWVNLASATINTDSSPVPHVFTNVPVYRSYRAIFKPSYDLTHLYEIVSTKPVEAVSQPVLCLVETSLSLTLNTTSTYAGKAFELVAHLTTSSGEPLAGMTIEFQRLNSSNWSVIGTSTTNSSGYAVFTFTEEYVGTYTYRAVFKGYGRYLASTSNNASLTVNPIPTNLALTIPSTTYTVDKTILKATLTTYDGKPVAGYNVEFWISSDGVTWVLLGENTTDSNGEAVYRHVFWVSGTYYVKANFTDPGKTNGIWRYNDTESSIEAIDVVKTPVELVLTANTTEAYVNQSISLSVTARDVYGNPLSGLSINVYYNDTLKYVFTTNSSGEVEWVEIEHTYMIYSLFANYTGNETYAEATSSTLTIKWSPLPTNTTLQAIGTPTPGANIELVAHVVDTVYDKPVVGYNVTFLVSLDNGTTWNSIGVAITDQEGYAKLNYSLNANVSTYYFKAVFRDPYEKILGEWIYQGSESTPIVVSLYRITTQLTLTANTTEAYAREPVELIARLIMSNGTPVSGEPIDFYIYVNSSWEYLGTVATNSSGYAVYIVSSNIAGTWDYKAVYNGSDTYSSAESDTVSITFKKIPVNIILSVSDAEVYVNQSIELIVNVTDVYGNPLPNITVEIYYNSTLKHVYITNASGQVSWFEIEHAYMIYEVVVKYSGNETYENSSGNTVVVKWKPLPTETTLYIETTGAPTIGSTVELIAHVEDKVYGKPVVNYSVEFWVSFNNGTTWNLIGTAQTDSQGYARLNYTLTVNTVVYYFKAVFNDPEEGVLGKWIYYGSESASTPLYLGRITTSLSLEANTTETYAGLSVELIARLTMSNGTPIAGETIDFYIYVDNEWKYLGSAVTNEFGYAIYTVSSAVAGEYDYKAVYSGSDTYSPSESNIVTITYDKRPVEIIVETVNPSQPYVGDTIEITIVLRSLGDPVSYAEIYLYNDTTLLGSTTTDLNGKAVFTIEDAVAGVYSLKIVFKGTNTYQANETSFSIIVKHHVELTLKIKYRFLKNGSVLFILNATLTIDGKPYSGQLVKFYRKGSWIYIGSNTTNSNGVALLYYIVNQVNTIQSYTFKAEYNSSSTIVESTSSIASKTVYPPPEYLRPPASPENPYIALALVLAILAMIALFKRKK